MENVTERKDLDKGNNFRFKAGLGVDYFFNNNLFLRGSLLLGVRFPYEFESDSIADGAKYWPGLGPDIRIGVGYKFYSQKPTPQPAVRASVQTPVQQQPTRAEYPTPSLSPSITYIISRDDQNYGPLSLENLRLMAQQGTFTRDTLVWRDGMPQWAAAGTILELAPLFGENIPPPLPIALRYNVAISYGPYDMDQLRQMVQQGTLTRDTPVWREGMAQWVAAGTIPELSSLFGNNPPPLPPPRRN
jgi:hypothetical protein